MLRWLIHRKLDSEERRLGVPVDYLRHVADVSPAAFLRFASILPFANSRKVLPKDAWYVAQFVGVQHADCGTCLQIGVNLARKDGVDPKLLKAAIGGDLDAMSDEMADVYRFAEAVMMASGEDDALREILRARYGERGLIELAYAIAGSQIFPIVKRALGYAKSCKLVHVEV